VQQAVVAPGCPRRNLAALDESGLESSQSQVVGDGGTG
jgi:hypothetical protein